MDKSIIIFNNRTEIIGGMVSLLTGEGFKVLVTDTLEQLKLFLQTSGVQLMITDIGKEKKGRFAGLEGIRRLREITNIPMIILSDKQDEELKLRAFDAGADDYVATSCNPLEILARVKAHIRRYLQLANACRKNKIYRIDELILDDNTRKVTVNKLEVRLTPIEYKILRLLVQERGKVMSNSQIYEAIWHMAPIGVDNTVAVHIRHIREKIEENPKEPQYLKVVWGIGYKLEKR
jgi:DNA-binding response OmpR family regulator